MNPSLEFLLNVVLPALASNQLAADRDRKRAHSAARMANEIAGQADHLSHAADSATSSLAEYLRRCGVDQADIDRACTVTVLCEGPGTVRVELESEAPL